MTEQQRHEELLRGYAESGECARGGTLWLDDIRVLLAALDTAREERDVLIEKLRIERGYNEGLRQERDAAMEALAAAEARLSVYRPIVEQAVAWHDWMDGKSQMDAESEELHALVKAMPDELYYEIVEGVEADSCRAATGEE